MNPAALRILQVNSLFTGGGVDNQTINLAAGLRDLGDAVIIAVPSRSRYEIHARNARLRIENIPARSFLKLGLIRRCVRIIRENKIQILHVHQGRDYWPCILAARLAGIGTRVVVTRHLMTRPRGLSRKLLLRHADVIAVSRAVEKVLRENLQGSPARIHQVYCGVDFSRLLPERTAAAEEYRARMGWPPEAVVFAVIGTFHPPLGKGQPEFLEAAAQLKDEFPRIRFAIIGHGEMEAELKARLAALGLEKFAAVHPFQDEISLCMSAIDVLVHPTRKGEAFPLVVLEALASGRPVIASRKDGIPEGFVEGEHGLLLPPGDVPALAAAMRALMKNPEQRKQFGRAGSAHVRSRFTVAELARRTRELYLQILRRD